MTKDSLAEMTHKNIS